MDAITHFLQDPTAVVVVKATLLLCAGLLLATVLQRAPAGVRHALWLGMVVALLVLPALSRWGRVPLRVLPPVGRVALGARIPGAYGTKDRASAARSALAAPDATDPGVRDAGRGAPPAVTLSIPATWSLARTVFTVWGVVAFALLAWLAGGFASVRRIVRRSQTLDAKDWIGPLYEIADRHGLDEAPRLVSSDVIAMPFACGFRHPVIVLPRDASSWTLERRRAVLMHELAHVKRRDLAGHTLGRVACALWWFHPMAWMAARRLRLESEKACDDLALACGLAPSTYAEHLLDIVSRVRRSDTPAFAIPMAHRGEFEGRVLAILDPARPRRGGRGRMAALGALLTALVLVVGAASPAPRLVAPLAPESVVAADTVRVARPVATPRPVTVPDEPAATRVPRSPGLPVSPVSPVSPGVSVSPVASVPPAKPVDERGVPRSLAQRALVDAAGSAAVEDRAEALMAVLKGDSSASIRRVAAWGLHEWAERAEVAAALASALMRDVSADVREMSAWALASGGRGREVIAALSEAVRRDASGTVRESAAWALAEIDATAAAEMLASAVTDTSAAMRFTAIWAIGQSDAKALPTAVIDALMDKEPHVRKAAVWAVYQTGDAAALPALERALAAEQDANLRRSYVRALGAIGEPASAALARLLDARDPELREAVVTALAGSHAGPWPWPRPRPRPFP